MGIVGIGAGAAAAMFGGNMLANSFSADDASASKRLQTAAIANLALGFGVAKFLKMKSIGEGMMAVGVAEGVLAWKAQAVEKANPAQGPQMVNMAAAVLGLPSPIQLAPQQLPAGGASTTTSTTTSTTAPMVMNRY